MGYRPTMHINKLTGTQSKDVERPQFNPYLFVLNLKTMCFSLLQCPYSREKNNCYFSENR